MTEAVPTPAVPRVKVAPRVGAALATVLATLIVTAMLVYTAAKPVAVFLFTVVRYGTGYVTTLVHELGHGAVGFISGLPFRQISLPAIYLHRDLSGETMSHFPEFRPVFKVVHRLTHLFAGYSAPIYAGFLLLLAAEAHNEVLGGWVLLPLSFLAVLSIRNLFATLVIVPFLFLNIWFFLSAAADATAYMWVLGAVLLVRGVIDVVCAAPMVFGADAPLLNGEAAMTDFHYAEEELRLPAQFWYVVFVVLNVVTLFFAFVAFAP